MLLLCRDRFQLSSWQAFGDIGKTVSSAKLFEDPFEDLPGNPTDKQDGAPVYKEAFFA